MIEHKVAVQAAAGSLVTYFGLTLADVDVIVRIAVGSATFALIVLGCVLKWKEIRKK